MDTNRRFRHERRGYNETDNILISGAEVGTGTGIVTGCIRRCESAENGGVRMQSLSLTVTLKAAAVERLLPEINNP